MKEAREGLSRDPHAAVFDETWLNATGYELLQGGDRDRAVQVFTLNAEAHAASANALDSLSEGLEAAGRPAEALQAAEKALAALPADKSVPAAQRASVEAGLKARIARLR
jgi:tetratricopeptide (TPR) repeat protein